MASEQERNKQAVRRLVAEVLDGHRLDVIAELYAPELMDEARAWIAPFLDSFPDTRMEILDLVAEGDRVAARFACSGTHTGEWLGHAASGRRFERIGEAGFYRLRDGRIVESWGVEDTVTRLEQLGLR